jgi:hypothetical protein
MPTPTRLLLSPQGTPTTSEQHRQASNNDAALHEDRIGIQSRRQRRCPRGHAVLPRHTASEIEIPHPDRQVKVSVADPEEQLEINVVVVGAGGSDSN